MTKCKLCGKPVRADESQANIPIYDEEGKNTGVDKYHFNCSFKVDPIKNRPEPSA